LLSTIVLLALSQRSEPAAFICTLPSIDTMRAAAVGTVSGMDTLAGGCL
jgi:hypothetical protein